MNGAELATVSLGLASAVSWGAGDFCGGVATKRAAVFRVVIASQVIGTSVMALMALARSDAWPPAGVVAWCAVAGIFGAIGLAALYRALASGNMGVAAPVSGVLSAAVPVLVAAVIDGAPARGQVAGFALAFVAVWLISSGEQGRPRLSGLALPVVAGVGFGLFIAIVSRASASAVFWPIVSARLGSMAFFVVAALAARQPWTPDVSQVPLLALTGICDAGGNVFVVLAAHAGRLDVAAVMSSLYPAFTVCLAWLLLGERLRRRQLAGFAAALAAIVLITAG